PARALRRKQTANRKSGAEGCALAPQAARNLQLFAAFSILIAIEPPP
ncbi:hypothetical protein A2U01_0107268, partial [Trifolium medium]|nr:hypothetical protein [Trifolium medium]